MVFVSAWDLLTWGLLLAWAAWVCCQPLSRKDHLEIYEGMRLYKAHWGYLKGSWFSIAWLAICAGLTAASFIYMLYADPTTSFFVSINVMAFATIGLTKIRNYIFYDLHYQTPAVLLTGLTALLSGALVGLTSYEQYTLNDKVLIAPPVLWAVFGAFSVYETFVFWKLSSDRKMMDWLDMTKQWYHPRQEYIKKMLEDEEKKQMKPTSYKPVPEPEISLLEKQFSNNFQGLQSFNQSTPNVIQNLIKQRAKGL